MFSISTIEIEPLCKDHSLPFSHICITKYCECSVKLCQKCVTQHQNDNQNSNILKIANYFNKIQTQIEILDKQQSNLKQLSQQNLSTSLNQSKQKFQKFALNQITILQDTMKYLNEESNKVNQQIKQASEVLSSKMENINIKRKDLPQTMAIKIMQNQLVAKAILFYNQKGFANFRKKLDKLIQFRGMLKDFLSYADKFGKQYQQFLKKTSMTASSQLSLKGTIKDIIPKSKTIKQKANTGDNFYQVYKQNKVSKQNLDNSGRPRRSRTIFGKKL